jgi:mannan endo-1,4-beta-mannosidase
LKRAHLPIPLLALMLAACQQDGEAVSIPKFQPCAAVQLDGGLIEVQGAQFVLGGKAIVPHGINSYPLLQHAGEERWDAVRDVFAQARALGRPLVRTNAFMDGGENPARLRDADGSLREEGLVALDGLLAEAANARVRLLLVLENNWDDYGGAPAVVRAVAPSEQLPKDAFWSDARALASQHTLIRAIVDRTNSITGMRYAQDPAIFAWELVNEARCTDTEYCDDRTLVRWARDMADAVRAAGAEQPVAWGGAGHRGRYGEDLAAIAKDGAVDILTVHIYPELRAPWIARLDAAARVDSAVLFGAEVLYDRIALARRHSMPLLVEELGYRPPEALSHADRDSERALVLRRLLSIAHAHGVATLPWMIGEENRPDYDGYLIEPDDASTLDVIACGSRS